METAAEHTMAESTDPERIAMYRFAPDLPEGVGKKCPPMYQKGNPPAGYVLERVVLEVASVEVIKC